VHRQTVVQTESGFKHLGMTVTLSFADVTEGSGQNERKSMGKLDGKVAIITGAARGLGRACAKRLAGLGAKGRRPTAAGDRLATSIRYRAGGLTAVAVLRP
jgi:hypothetical protein